MKEPIRWLHGELERWVAAGIVSRDQAGRLRGLYPAPAAALPWGMIIFSGLGAALAGLGVILFFAYNWHSIPKFGKLAVVFGSLLAAHGSGLRLLARPDWRRQLGEALALLGTMLFGAGIWLIAQVYNIDEHFPNGFLLWAFGALALAWTIPSVPQGIAAAVLLCVWSCTEAAAFETPPVWAPLLLAAGAGGLAVRTRSLTLAAVVVLGLYVMLIVNAAGAAGTLAFGTALSFAALLSAAALWARHTRYWPEPGPQLTFFGYAGFLVTLYVLSFAHGADEFLNWSRHETSTLNFVCHGWVPLGLALATWAGWLVRWMTRAPAERPALRPEWCLVPGSLVVVHVFGFSETARVAYATPVAALFNLILLSLAGVWMAQGCREGQLKPTIAGSLLLVCLAIARYFDLFESLLTRAAVFFVVGGILFGEGFFYRRARRPQTGNGGPE